MTSAHFHGNAAVGPADPPLRRQRPGDPVGPDRQRRRAADQPLRHQGRARQRRPVLASSGPAGPTQGQHGPDVGRLRRPGHRRGGLPDPRRRRAPRRPLRHAPRPVRHRRVAGPRLARLGDVPPGRGRLDRPARPPSARPCSRRSCGARRRSRPDLSQGTCPPGHFKSASASPRARASAATTSTPCRPATAASSSPSWTSPARASTPR